VGRWDRLVQRAIRRYGLNRPAVISHSPLAAGFAPMEWAGRVTFYATDDFTAHPAFQRYRPALDEAYARLARSGRAVCAVSQELLDRIAPTGPGLVVPNGVDPAEWASPGAAPAWFEQLPRPRVLYVGTLDRRIDIDCVTAAAEAVPDGTVVLMGGARDEAHMGALAGRANVVLHDSVPRGELAAVVSAADAGIVPHARTRLTTAMSPLKVYEYLAAGLPVAAVDLPGLRGIDDRVLPADGPAEFRGAVQAALVLGKADEAARARVIAEHGWPARLDRILELALG
jgi:glycosyltransferase involved in cell wall biosynthesis